jgi:hypothetical protein
MGWSLVRDVVNMFVILVLLVIAMATIVGYEKASWQKNLPQFLMAVILVNFSRTICGVLIDISQVVMFTFVNALLDVAAGNFAVLFNLDDFGEYSANAVRDNTTGAYKSIDGFQQLGAAYLQFILYAVICAVLLLLALVYIWRIILLWVLVILSPLTFFTWGLGGMFKFAAGSSADWWKKFTAALVLGPMLTFFLWLALATATGDIVNEEGFKVGQSFAESTLVSFETSNLLGTMIGLILLIVGMQQSSASANAMGGLAKKVMGDEKTGQNLVKGAVSWAGGYSAARGGANAVGRAAGLGTSLGAQVGKIPVVGGALGRAIIDSSGAVQQRTEAFSKKGKDAADKRVKAMTTDQKAAHLANIANGRTGAIGASARDDIAALQTATATDAGLRKKNKENLPEQYQQLNVQALKYADANKDSLDDAQKDKVAKFKTEQAHLLNSSLKDDKALEKHIQSDKFNGRDLSKEAAGNEDVLKALKDRVVRTKEDGTVVTALDELKSGVYGKDLAEAAKGVGATKVYDSSSASEREGASLATLRPPVLNSDGSEKEAARPYTAEELATNIRATNIKPESLTAADFAGPNGAALTTAVIDTDSIAKMSAAARDGFTDAIDRMPKGSMSLEQRAKTDRTLMENGESAFTVGLMPINVSDGGGLNPEMQLRVEQIIQSDTNSVRHLQAGMPTDPDESNDITSTIVEKLKATDIQKLGEQAAKASGAELANIKQTLDTIKASLKAERVNASMDPALSTKIDKLDKAHRAASRYVA